ncbi:XRE family transcriptional regulator [Streptomyces sp. NBC_00094]|uniref:helix-turn-helix domain-containing protein n=1 Tax=Streptomyces sp. NBC_00094 TaxID=2903620 RepID=UPI00225968B7|nr:XRE family transcriptional regulator [Streptomyces sp. NBC_00094]MCX5392692.1 XRE family transcriptional regulator [Streptomyces sp. NBC_00094]
MPGWKALSDELDPDVRAFTERIRRLIDRSGLAVTAVAERTGHDRSAWDAYLSARLPVPRSAVAALAEVTGADPGDLAQAWDRADRTWRRSDAPGGRRDGDGPGGPDDGEAPGGSVGRDGSEGSYGPDGSYDPGGLGDDRTMQIRRLERAPSPLPGPRPSDGSLSDDPPFGPRLSDSPHSDDPPPGSPPPPRRRSLLLYGAGVLGALLVVTAALLLVDLGGTDGTDGGAAAPPSSTAPTAAPRTSLPAGVQCTGPGCTGRDPEAMGCGGPLATTVARTRVGAALVEVRHSATCAAAWARITGAVPGDAVDVEVAGATRSATVSAGADTDAYTPMLAVTSGADARACATLADGREACTAN